MSEGAVELKVGLLVAVCLAVLAGFIVALGDFTTTARADLFLDLPTSANLKPGAPVKIAGVTSGKVADVIFMGGEYDEAQKREVWVRVHLRIDHARLSSIHTDARFFVTNQGLLGEKCVEIEPGTVKLPSVQPGATMLGEPPMRLEMVAQNATRLLESLSRLIARNEALLDQTLKETADTMGTLRGTVERIDGILADNGAKVTSAMDALLVLEKDASELLRGLKVVVGDGESLKRAIKNVEELSGEARQHVMPVATEAETTLKKYGKLADEGLEMLEMTRSDAQALLADGRSVVKDIRDMMGRIETGDGSIGALLRDQELYDDIREMVKDLKRHPWKFLWKQ